MSEQKDLERARVVDAMCMTWRHDFGLDRKDDELFSCGMTDTERDALRRKMGQLYDHHFAASSLPVGVPDGEQLKAKVLELIGDECKYWQGRDEARRGGFAILYAKVNELAATAAPTVKAEQVLVTHDLRAKLISGLDEIGALSRNLRQGGCDSSDLPGLEEGLAHAIGMTHELISLLEAPSLPTAGSADLTDVRCQCCATEYPHDSYDAGFIAGSGMCQVCDAAMPPKDLPAAGSTVEEVEVVGYRFFHVDHGYIFRRTHIYEGNPSLEAHSLMTVAQHERIVAALYAQLRDANNLADQWAEKNAALSAPQSAQDVSVTLRSSMELIKIYRDQLVEDDAEPEDVVIADQTLSELRALLNGGEA